jgi:hypothetical protein
MAKVTLTDIANLENQTSAVQVINQNNADVEAAFENTLSRDGTTPNAMGADFDMNGYSIINLPSPVSGASPVRLSDVVGMIQVTNSVLPSTTGQATKVLSNDGAGTLLWVAQNVNSLIITNNLSDLSNAVIARTNLGLGSAAVVSIGTSGPTVPLLNTANSWSNVQTLLNGFVTGTSTSTLNGDLILAATVAPTERSLGYRGAPQGTQDGTYTLVATDSGTTVKHTSSSAHTWTIPPQSSVAWPNGTTIVLLNIGTGVVTVARGAGVSLRIAGSSTDSNKSLAQYGLATLYKAADDSWIISGGGVT